MPDISNLEQVESFLDVLLSNLLIMESEMEKSLRQYSLVVGDFDPKLKDSHWLEWPIEVSDSPGDTIGFHYYKAMRLKSTTSSAYIRKRYEEASRDMTGNGVIDFLYLVDVTKKEALLIQDFIADRGDILGTASEQILENFQIWIQTAIIQTKRVYQEFNKETRRDDARGSSKAPRTPQEARRSQALLKVDLNGRNIQIAKALDSLVQSFRDRADTFYSKFLSGVEVADSESLESLLKDQKLRFKLYREKMDLLSSQIAARDAIREQIWGLSEMGRTMPVSGPGVMINAETTSEELQHWQNIEDQADVGPEYSSAVADTPKDFLIQGTHDDLPGLLKGDPHSQYLLKAGGTVTGDIAVQDGITIDGADVSAHKHTGLDGTQQIDGKDILKNSLADDLVDENDIPPVPINLTVPRMDLTVVPPGVSVVDTHLTWDSYDRYMHELEVRLIPEPASREPGGDIAGLFVGTYAQLPGYAIDGPKLYRVTPGLSVEEWVTPNPDGNGAILAGGAVTVNDESTVFILDDSNETAYQAKAFPTIAPSDWTQCTFPNSGSMATTSGMKSKIVTSDSVVFAVVQYPTGTLTSYRSDDAGTTWSESPLPSPDFGGTNRQLIDLSYSRGRFYRWRESGDTQTDEIFPFEWSTDGVNWNAETAQAPGWGGIRWGSLVYGGDGLWMLYHGNPAVGGDCLISDDDGDTWTITLVSDLPVTSGGGTTTPGSTPVSFYGIAPGNQSGTLIASVEGLATLDDVVWYSYDTISGWTQGAFVDQVDPHTPDGTPLGNPELYWFTDDNVVDSGGRTAFRHDIGSVALTDDNGETVDLVKIGETFEDDGYYYHTDYIWSTFSGISEEVPQAFIVEANPSLYEDASAFQPLNPVCEITVTGGVEPIVLTLSGDPGVPFDLSLDDNGDGTGTISGTSFSNGYFVLTVTATDAESNEATVDIEIDFGGGAN